MSDISFVPLSWIKTEVDFALGQSGQIARLQWIIEIPNTVSPGDFVDLTGLEMVIGAANAAALNALITGGTFNGIQIYGYKYRFIQSPFPFATNSGVQLTGVDSQPRTIPRKSPTFF